MALTEHSFVEEAKHAYITTQTRRRKIEIQKAHSLCQVELVQEALLHVIQFC